MLRIRGEHGAVWCGFCIKPQLIPLGAVFLCVKPHFAVFAVFIAFAICNGAVSILNRNYY